jgi:AhpD family alkylhydroperoxidase
MAMRANYFDLAADGINILMKQESYLQQQFTHSEVITVTLWEMVKLRISQINQCAFCIDLHSRSAQKHGESAERLLGLSAWRDMPMYSDIERAALEWAELLTQGNAINDATYQHKVAILGEQALVDLTIAVNAINSWNRMAKTFKPLVGSFEV